MPRRSAQILIACAALAVGVSAWFLDDVISHWQQAQAPRGASPQAPGGGGGGQAGTKVDAPAVAFLPPFDASHMTNTQLLAHYVKQLPLPKNPTLEDWQKV